MSIDKLNELVKDNPELLAFVAKLADEAGVKTKVQDANAALTAEREALKATIATLKEKKKDGDASTADIALLNSLREKLDAVTSEVTKIKTERDTAIAESKQKDLKSAIISAAATHKALKPDDLFTIMSGKKLAGHTEDGKPYFHKINDAGQPVAVTAEEAVAALKGSSPEYFASSGTRGSGNGPSSGTAGNFDALKHL